MTPVSANRILIAVNTRLGAASALEKICTYHIGISQSCDMRGVMAEGLMIAVEAAKCEETICDECLYAR